MSGDELREPMISERTTPCTRAAHTCLEAFISRPQAQIDHMKGRYGANWCVPPFTTIAFIRKSTIWLS